MNYTASINIMPHKELLDPQGKAVCQGLQKMGFETITDVRIGRHISLQLSAKNKEEATQMVEESCKKLLANGIMEGYQFELTENK